MNDNVHLESIHEGKTFLVFLGDISVKFLLQVQFLFFVVVVIKGGLDVHVGGHYCCDGLTQGVDLEEVSCTIKIVKFFGGKFTDESVELFTDDIFEDVSLDFRGLLDFVVEDDEDVEDELEGGLVDVGDFDLSEVRVTPPCSMALASLMYCMTLSCFSVNS